MSIRHIEINCPPERLEQNARNERRMAACSSFAIVPTYFEQAFHTSFSLPKAGGQPGLLTAAAVSLSRKTRAALDG